MAEYWIGDLVYIQWIGYHPPKTLFNRIMCFVVRLALFTVCPSASGQGGQVGSAGGNHIKGAIKTPNETQRRHIWINCQFVLPFESSPSSSSYHIIVSLLLVRLSYRIIKSSTVLWPMMMIIRELLNILAVPQSAVNFLYVLKADSKIGLGHDDESGKTNW